MLKDYAAWTKGAKDVDVAAIRSVMNQAAQSGLAFAPAASVPKSAD
jgi:hypothetical protein